MQRIEELERERDECRRQAEENTTRRHYMESVLQQVPNALVTLDFTHRIVDSGKGLFAVAAGILKHCFRSRDILVLIGINTFAVLLP